MRKNTERNSQRGRDDLADARVIASCSPVVRLCDRVEGHRVRHP